jgi:hypothetical protein
MLQLKAINDPRDALEKARRYELYQWARANGVTEIVETMPAILMRKILRARGLARIEIPKRTLGAPEQAAPPVTSDTAIDATSDLEQQWKREQLEPPPPPKKRGRRPKVKQDG